MIARDPIAAEEALVARLLAPLAELEPAFWPGPPPRRDPGVARVWRPAPARPPRLRRLVAVALLIATGAAASAGYAIEQWVTRAASPSPANAGGPLGCLPLVGQPGATAAAVLESRHVTVSWRFTRYADPTRSLPTTSAPPAPPAQSVVEDVAVGADGATVVFLRAVDDPWAPPIAPHEECPSGSP